MKKKILLVDDDEVFLKILTNRLAKNFEIEAALDGQEFIKKALAWNPDLVILDIMLGKENGPHVYDRLLGCGFSHEVPILFLSTLVENSFPPKLRSGRRTALLSKYFSAEDLSSNIEVLIGQKT